MSSVIPTAGGIFIVGETLGLALGAALGAAEGAAEGAVEGASLGAATLPNPKPSYVVLDHDSATTASTHEFGPCCNCSAAPKRAGVANCV